MASVVRTPEADWDAILAINLKGVAMGCKHAIPIMVNQGRGVIVNIASINGIAGLTGADAYTAAKGGVVALTRVLAVDWAAKGVRVNCVCPGAVDTPMIREALNEPSLRNMVNTQIPLGRTGNRMRLPPSACFSPPTTLCSCMARLFPSTADRSPNKGNSE
jgi:meso-butanediol dehydrogenase/(S,S)-butanediol dehydrogenase/diacetyl reductase